MVKRADFEKEIVSIIVPAITHAQDVVEAKYGIRLEVQLDWHLTKGKFEDETTSDGIGG